MSRQADTSNNASEKTYFEKQREALVREIGVSMEHVLQNINKLNRNLEGIIEVGNEFSSVEALWSHFENVMSKDGSQGEQPQPQPQQQGKDTDDNEGEATARVK